MRLLLITIAVVLDFMVAHVFAADLTIQDAHTIQHDGQKFFSNFTADLPPDGSGVAITLQTSLAPGGDIDSLGLDLDNDEGQEFFELTFDGISQGRFNCGGGDGSAVTMLAAIFGDDCIMFHVVHLSGPTLDTFLQDGIFTVGVLFGENVNAFEGFDQIIVGFSYRTSEIPLPSASLFFLCGLGAAGACRKLVGRMRAKANFRH